MASIAFAMFNVKWNWLPDGEKPSLKGHDYLVALPDDINGKILYPIIAQWHEAGDVVLLGRDIKKMPDGLSDKEKLLRLIHESLYPYTVAVTGFYVLETDSDVPDELAEKGCVQYLEYLGDELFWSQMPSMPEGYISSDEHEDREQQSRMERQRRAHEERVAYLRKQAEEDSYISKAGRIGEIADGVDYEMTLFCGTKYAIPSVRYAECMCAARKMLDVATTVTDEEIARLSDFQEQGDKQKALALIDKIFTRAGVSDIEHRKKLVYILCNASGDLFVNYRSYFCSRYKNDKSKIVQILTQAMLKKNTIDRIIQRFRRISAMGAPEIILLNEFRIFAQELAAFCSPECIVGVDEEKFGKYFHVWPDGRFYEYHDDDFEPNNGIGKDFPYFAVQALPNHMMFEKGWSIRDNRKSYSFILDSNGRPFRTWEDAKRKADELAKELVRATATSGKSG